MRRSTKPPPLSARVGAYELLYPLGVGATGVVWKAHRLHPVPLVVALKRLHRSGRGPNEQASIRREAELLSRLHHPNLVELVEVVDDGDGVALAMQLAAGGSLASLLADRGRLSASETIAVAAPIADALGVAHRLGVIHGDVKPSNILFTAAGEPLLADFDVARTAGRPRDATLAGTEGYLAPEVLVGRVPSRRSDIYALGVVCFEAMAGYVPCTGRSAARQPLGDVPAPLADVITRATAGDRTRRFGSADELARALRAAAPRGSIRLPRPTAPRARPGPWLRDRRTLRFGPRPPRPEIRVRWTTRLARRLLRRSGHRAPRRPSGQPARVGPR